LHGWSSRVAGLLDFPEEGWPPVATPLVALRGMIGPGTVM